MDYITNSKNRKLKNKIHTILSHLSFNFLHLSRSSKVIGIGLIISFVSLFVNWFTIVDLSIPGSAFSINAGYVGYIIVVILCILIFLLLSDGGKEKLKTKASFTFSDHTIIIFSGLMIFFLTFVIFNSIRGFITFSQNIIVGDGLIFELIGSIFITAGGLLHHREKKQELLRMMYIENSQSTTSGLEEYDDILKKNDSNKQNMILPI